MTDEPFITFRYADDLLVGGEFDHVTSLDWFDDDSRDGNCFEVLEERWKLVGVRVHKFGDRDRSCHLCDEDVELEEPTPGPVYCPGCDGQA